ncbi:MAG TPA: hypothetical protein VJW20_16855, partial [Candidatus Angelobacter sp.]|nr:hypothetical protein [Candidatus Angelobacter sp.]
YTLSPTFFMRVRGYGSAAGQTADLTRPITQSPGYATFQDICFDVVMDTTLGWDFTPPIVATNQDEGASTNLYITVTNLSNGSTNGSVTLQYAPIAGFKGQF